MFRVREAQWVLGLALATVALPSCSEPDTPPDGPPDLVVITFDTTRADHLGPYGASQAETPTLETLAAEGYRFERAYATAPITLPSHVSMFTSTWPAQHGVRDNGLFELSDRATTIAEALRDEAGYSTAGFVAAYVLDSRFGLGQGFDHFPDSGGVDSSGRPITELTATAIVDRALSWLADVPDDQPLFLWAHFFDPHAPYAPPEPFRSRHADRYDGEIAYADSELSRLLSKLREQRGDRAWTIFTSDHGEGLGEHDEQSHGVLLFDGTMRIPLLVRPPGGLDSPRHISHPVSNAAIATTLAELSGLGRQHLTASSVPPLFTRSGEPTDDPEEPVYFETYLPLYSYQWAPLEGVVFGSHKLIRSDARSELYEWTSDPAEANDLAGSATPADAALTRLLDHYAGMPSLQWDRDEDLSEADTQKLQSLGYVTGSRRTANANLPDPRDRIPALAIADRVRGFLDATELFEARGEPERLPALFEQASAELERLIAIDPDGALTLELQGRYFTRRGQRLRARDPLEQALLHRPRDQGLHYLLAGSYRAAKDWDLAEREYRKVIQLEPRAVDAYRDLCQLLMRQQRLDEAVGYGQRAVAKLEQAGIRDPSIEGWVATMQAQLSATGRTPIEPSDDLLDLRPERIVRDEQ